MNVCKSSYEMIGHTPMLELCHIEKELGLSCRILADAIVEARTGITLTEVAYTKDEGKTIVVLFPDGGDRYFSTPLFED